MSAPPKAPVKAWAIAIDGIYDVRTVSPSRRGAIVRWLGQRVTHDFAAMSDEQVEALWGPFAAFHGASAHEAWVSEGQ